MECHSLLSLDFSNWSLPLPLRPRIRILTFMCLGEFHRLLTLLPSITGFPSNQTVCHLFTQDILPYRAANTTDATILLRNTHPTVIIWLNTHFTKWHLLVVTARSPWFFCLTITSFNNKSATRCFLEIFPSTGLVCTAGTETQGAHRAHEDQGVVTWTTEKRSQAIKHKEQ